MSEVVHNKLLLYAVDSAILVSGKNISMVEKAVSEDLLSMSHSLIDNKLSLHLGKTKSILFGFKQKLKAQSSLYITCNNTTISSTRSVKYLCVTIDQHLFLNSMVISVIKKANARLKILYRKKRLLHTAYKDVTTL